MNQMQGMMIPGGPMMFPQEGMNPGMMGFPQGMPPMMPMPGMPMTQNNPQPMVAPNY